MGGGGTVETQEPALELETQRSGEAGTRGACSLEQAGHKLGGKGPSQALYPGGSDKPLKGLCLVLLFEQ